MFASSLYIVEVVVYVFITQVLSVWLSWVKGWLIGGEVFELFLCLYGSWGDGTLKGFSGCGVSLGKVRSSSIGCRFMLSGLCFARVSNPRIRGNGIGIRLAMGEASHTFRLDFRASNVM